MQNLSVTLVDAGGHTGTTLLHLTDAALLVDGLAALLAASNADWIAWWGGPATLQATPAPAAAVYLTLRPAAVLFFGCADGSTARVSYKAPVAALFLADGETVDASDPTGALAALQAVITSATGSPATSFLGGILD